ncbi:MAG: hypothetical protein DRP85_00395 [Candidatus Makaraimicrobium thalassicum]|nr:MAG: hypothetical protein DRP85_00395 [Candidatus Omnitrophota bacterium]
MNKARDKELKNGKSYCMRLLSLRPRSEHEIDDRLEGRGYDDRARKCILESLKISGLVDDLKFAREWIDSRVRSNPRGIKILRGELRKKQVPESIIEEAVRERAAELDDRAVADALVRKRLRAAKDPSHINTELKGKLFRFLVGKGVDMEVAEEAVNRGLGGT